MQMKKWKQRKRVTCLASHSWHYGESPWTHKPEERALLFNDQARNGPLQFFFLSYDENVLKIELNYLLIVSMFSKKEKKRKKIWAIASGRSVLYSCKRQSGRKAWYVKLLHFLSNLDDLWENKRKQNTWTCYDKKDKHFRLRGCPSVTQTTCHRGQGALSCAGVHWNAITPPWGHSNKGVLTDYCHSVKV